MKEKEGLITVVSGNKFNFENENFTQINLIKMLDELCGDGH